MKHKAYLELTIDGMQEVLRADFSKNQLAFHFDLENLEPGAAYRFDYAVLKGDGEVMEIKRGTTFHTFENDPQILKFSAMSSAQTLSETSAFEYLVSNKPDLILQLGEMHELSNQYLSSGMFQQSYHEVFMSSQQRETYSNYPIVHVWG